MFTNLKSKLRNKLKEDVHLAELLKGSGVAFILRILGIICGYFFTLLVTRTLGAEAWGIFSLCLVVLQISSVIGRLGMDIALLRFTAEYTAKGEIGTLREIYKKALNLVVPFSIFVSISVYFLSPILSTKVFHKPYLTSYFKIISVAIVPFVLLWIHSESIRGLKKIKQYMLLQQAGIFSIALLLFLIELFFVKTKFLPIVSYTISIIVISIISIYLWRKYLIHITSTISYSSTTSKNSTTSYQYLLSVSIPMLLSSSMALLMAWTDTIMLGVFTTTQKVGIYNVSSKVSMLLSLFFTSVAAILTPKIGRLLTLSKFSIIENLIRTVTIGISSILLPLFILFCFFGKDILALFGHEFSSGYSVLITLSLGQIIVSILGFSGTILLMGKQEKFVSKIIFFSLLLNIFLNLLLIPKFDILGAAIATTIVKTVWYSLFSLASYRYFGILVLPFRSKHERKQ